MVLLIIRCPNLLSQLHLVEASKMRSARLSVFGSTSQSRSYEQCSFCWPFLASVNVLGAGRGVASQRADLVDSSVPGGAWERPQLRVKGVSIHPRSRSHWRLQTTGRNQARKHGTTAAQARTQPGRTPATLARAALTPDLLRVRRNPGLLTGPVT